MRDREYEMPKLLKILLINEKGIKLLIFVKKEFKENLVNGTNWRLRFAVKVILSLSTELITNRAKRYLSKGQKFPSLVIASWGSFWKWGGRG